MLVAVGNGTASAARAGAAIATNKAAAASMQHLFK
jgi:hypothetical protein